MANHIFGGVLLAGVLTLGLILPEPPSEPLTVAALIKRLADDDPQIREEATKLLSAREDAVSALRLALRSDDAEVARLARVALDSIQERDLNRRKPQLAGYVRAGQYDLAIECLLACEKDHLPPGWWQSFVDGAGNLIKKEGTDYKRTSFWNGSGSRWLDFNTYTQTGMFREFSLGRPTLELPPDRNQEEWLTACRAERFIATGPNPLRHHWAGVAAVASEAKVTAPGGAFLACGGDCSFGRVGYSVIFCAGDCEIEGGISESIVVVRGNCRAGKSTYNSVLLVGGQVDILGGGTTNSTIRARGKINIKNPEAVDKKSEIVPNDPKALDGVRFFELADLGLAVTAAENRLRVERLAADSPLARAGLREGDTLDAVGTAAPTDSETLRRALRRAFVQRSIVLKVQRDGQPREIPVRFPD